MAEVCQGNVYLTISEDEIDKYLSKGFSLVDERTGKIIKQSIPTEIGPLKKLYSEQLEINKKLTSEINNLRNKIALLEAEAAKATSVPEESTSWDSWGEDDTPKKKKSAKK